MKLSIKQWGNGAGLPLSKPLLKLIRSEIGDTVEAQVVDGGLMIKPIAEPEYSLDELLATCTKGNTRLDDEDRAWISDTPVGKEL